MGAVWRTGANSPSAASVSAVLLAAAVVFGAQAGRADTVTAFEDATVLVEGDVGLAGWDEETVWIDDPIADEVYDGTEDWSSEDGADEETLADWDEMIAWSGVPLGEDGVLYMSGDWVKRGDGADGTTPVPLPGAGLLLLAGLTGLVAMRRRRGA